MSDLQNDGVARLERLLAQSRAHGQRGLRQLHAVMLLDIEAALLRARQAEQRTRKGRTLGQEKAERRADHAERRLANARSRAERAEEQLAQLQASRTWKAGRLVTAVPRRVAKVVRKRLIPLAKSRLGSGSDESLISGCVPRAVELGTDLGGGGAEDGSRPLNHVVAHPWQRT